MSPATAPQAPGRSVPGTGKAHRHVLVAIVLNKPGVLNRVASLFRRSGFNIDSLAVGTTEEAGISRGLLYHYFGDKKGLYMAVLEAAYVDLRAREAELKIDFEVRSINAIKSLVARGAATGILPCAHVLDEVRSGKLDANDSHIIHICDWLFTYAFQQRASDIHLEPRREVSNVRFRIDGALHQVYQIPTPVMAAMTSRIKVMGRMDVVEKRRPQDGRLKTVSPDGSEVELRLSTMPTAFGEKFVMRIFDPETLIKDYKDLGFGEEDERKWKHMVSQPHGIVLVTGPTGSGKTTTLYSTLKSLATPEVNVCSVEDPIEMVEPSFNQMQVQAGLGVNFAAGIRTLMRQDPDIIMVGEIRDLETAEMAVQAALTGHLVLSTLHTNDAPAAISRLIDLGVPGYLIQSTLLGVMAQRLIRTICPHCREQVDLDDATWENLVAPWKAPNPKGMTARGKGCLECRMTGYMGRMGIYETMVLSPEVKRFITDTTDLESFREAAYKDGLKPLRINGAMKVAAGLTTVDEILKIAPPPGGDRRTTAR